MKEILYMGHKIIKKNTTIYVLDIECFNKFNEALAQESSDRARLIISAAWIDNFLKVKLQNEFSMGNAKAQKILFSENGSLGTFSAKLNIAYCAGWIEADVYHDLTVIRKLRNKFAHTVDPVSLDEPKTRSLIESFQVPYRQYHDWGKLRAAAADDGIILYTGEKPNNAKEDLFISGIFTFRMAIPLILSVLVANLGILFTTQEKGSLAKIYLPKHMKRAIRKGVITDGF